jgi:hypothetical protein
MIEDSAHHADWSASTPFSIISKCALRPGRRPSGAMPGQMTDSSAHIAITWLRYLSLFMLSVSHADQQQLRCTAFDHLPTPPGSRFTSPRQLHHRSPPHTANVYHRHAHDPIHEYNKFPPFRHRHYTGSDGGPFGELHLGRTEIDSRSPSATG